MTPRHAGREHAREAFANRPFRRLLVAFAFVMAAEWAVVAAISVHAYRVGGALAVGLLGLRFVPAAVVGLAAARFIEQRQPARLLRLVAAGRALCTAGVAAALAGGLPYGVVLALLALDGAIAALYRPAQAALLPSLVSTPGELTAGASLLGNVKTGSQVMGALAGGLLVVPTSTAAVAAGAAGLIVVAAAVVPFGAARAGLIGPRAVPGPSRMRRGALHVAALATVRSLIRGLWLALVVVVAIRLIDLGASLPLFARLPREGLREIAEQFRTADYGPHDTLVRQGDPGDRYFFVLSGTVDVSVDGRPVAELMAGDGFGEIALLHDIPRRATVTARGDVRVATLGRASFNGFASSVGLAS